VATPGVDFFRVDRSKPTRRFLTAGAILVAIGMGLTGAHLMRSLGDSTGHEISLVGGAFVLTGLVLAIGSMAGVLFENVYLSIEEKRLLVHDNGNETSIGWDELSAVDLDGRGMVILRAGAAREIRFYAGGASRQLAKCVEDARRKASLGILKIDSSRPPPSKREAS
jgi:hypothetical protein